MERGQSRSSVNNQIQPIRCGTFLKKDLKTQDDVIENGILSSRSIMIVGGISKAGKSVFILNMGLCLAAGKPFLLQFNIPNQNRVLYVQAEIGEKPLQNRLIKMIKSQPIEQNLLNKNLILINNKQLKLDRERDLLTIGQIIDHYQANVLIIDPLYKFHMGDENRVQDMTRFFDGIDSLVTDYGCSVVIVHHFGKPSQENKRYGAMQLRGSSAIFDYADSYISLNRKSGKEPRNYIKATFELRNEADPDPLYLFRNPDTLWYEVMGDESQSKVSIHDVIGCLDNMGGRAMRKDFISNLKENTGAGQRTIVDAINKTETLKKIRSTALSGKGNPKMYYLPNCQTEIG